MAIELPPLPYAQDALAPHISGETLEYHYGKHHQAYVTNVNKMYDGDKSLEALVQSSDGGLFNNAAQVWNHTCYWNSMKPGGGGDPMGAVLDAIDGAFGSVADFKQQFSEAAMTQFGSGWAWLALDGGQMKILKTPNADTPLAHGQTALLTCDVWEHAYYIDYRNARAKYVATFLDHLANWDHVAARMG